MLHVISPIRINSDAVQNCIAVNQLQLKRVNGFLPVREHFKELREADHFQNFCYLRARVKQFEMLLRHANGQGI